MARSELSRLLRNYQPSDAQELEFLRRMRELVERPSALTRGSYAPGHFTASAFVLSPERDSLLLIFHEKLRIWVQPGGHIDPTDSDVCAAARREVAEEVGLEQLTLLAPDVPLFDIDIHAIPDRPKEPAHEHFDVRFAFLAESREVRTNLEVRDALWVKLDEVPRVTSDRSVVRATEKLRQLVERA